LDQNFRGALRLDFDRLMFQFRGSAITSDGGLLTILAAKRSATIEFRCEGAPTSDYGPNDPESGECQLKDQQRGGSCELPGSTIHLGSSGWFV
jgi:hypothetical protein